jgi:dihydropteroate synthase
MLKINRSLNCNGRLLELQFPKVMGILNVTPDSFYDGGNYKTNADVINHVEKMILDGVDIIDVGGQSTRPQAQLISKEVELERVIPIIKAIKKHFESIVISVDTFYSEVAEAAVAEGAGIINDVSGFALSTNILKVAYQNNCPYVLMHSGGISAEIQTTEMQTDVVSNAIQFFKNKVAIIEQFGIKDLILDPGFGFGKTIAQNFELLNELSRIIDTIQLPILVGLSRKSMIYKTLNTDAMHALDGTIVANTIALLNGASILRVHDIAAAKVAIKIVDATVKKY